MQTKREAAYFVVVLHDLKTVVIAVRGTETPEDLITDGLCRECSLTMDDLDGLIKKVSPSIYYGFSLYHYLHFMLFTFMLLHVVAFKWITGISKSLG